MALIGAQFVNAVSPNPVGSLQAYAGPNAPTGWLLCDGSSYSTTAYPELYDAIGYTYGGSGANFNVPDLRGRTPIGSGQGSGLTNRTLGQADGAETHQLTVAEMPSHSHQQYNGWGGGSYVLPYWDGNGARAIYGAANGGATGGNGAHNNMPPFLVTNYIIKAASDAPRSGLAYGSTPPIVTQLPSNPQFGDVVTYIADATNGVAWSLQYDGSGSYPWKFIGGAPLYSASTGAFTTTSTTWTLWSTSPNITIPLAGDYINEVAASTGQQTNAVNSQYCTIGINGSGQSTHNGVWSTSSGQWDGSTGMTVTRLTFAASDNLRFYCREDYGSQTAAFDKGRLTVTPVRVA